MYLNPNLQYHKDIQPILEVHFDKVVFTTINYKWKNVTEIHIFVHGEACIGSLGCAWVE
jgi:hypothetical protein